LTPTTEFTIPKEGVISGSSLFLVGMFGCFWLVLQSLSFWLDPKGPKTQGFLKMVFFRTIFLMPPHSRMIFLQIVDLPDTES
jgi:hypothetical protein